MIDAHFHLDETMISLSNLITSMNDAGIERAALIPALCPPITLPIWANSIMPILQWFLHQDGGPLHQIALWIYDNTVKKNGMVDVFGAEYPIIDNPNNDLVIQAIAKYPQRFLGYVFVNPKGPSDPMNELERLMVKPGIIGVKAHPYWHNYSIELLTTVADYCETNECPMLIHLGTGDKGDFRLLPERFPKLKVIYAHAGVPYVNQVCEYARENRNVYIDLSGSVFINASMISKAIQKAGPDKCIFGTDGPYFHIDNNRFNYKRFTQIIKNIGLEPNAYRQIVNDNFLALTHIK